MSDYTSKRDGLCSEGTQRPTPGPSLEVSSRLERYKGKPPRNAIQLIHRKPGETRGMGVESGLMRPEEAPMRPKVRGAHHEIRRNPHRFQVLGP